MNLNDDLQMPGWEVAFLEWGQRLHLYCLQQLLLED